MKNYREPFSINSNDGIHNGSGLIPAIAGGVGYALGKAAVATIVGAAAAAGAKAVGSDMTEFYFQPNTKIYKISEEV